MKPYCSWDTGQIYKQGSIRRFWSFDKPLTSFLPNASEFGGIRQERADA